MSAQGAESPAERDMDAWAEAARAMARRAGSEADPQGSAPAEDEGFRSADDGSWREYARAKWWESSPEEPSADGARGAPEAGEGSREGGWGSRSGWDIHGGPWPEWSRSWSEESGQWGSQWPKPSGATTWRGWPATDGSDQSWA